MCTNELFDGSVAGLRRANIRTLAGDPAAVAAMVAKHDELRRELSDTRAALGARDGESTPAAARRVVGALRQAEADMAAIYLKIEELRAKAAPESEDGETVRAYVVPNGIMHRLFGIARGASYGTALLAEMDELRAAAVFAKETWQRGEATRRAQAARIEQLLREIDMYGRQAMCESAELAAARKVVEAARAVHDGASVETRRAAMERLGAALQALDKEASL